MSTDFPIPGSGSGALSGTPAAPTLARSKSTPSLSKILEKKSSFIFLGQSVVFPSRVVRDNSNTFPIRTDPALHGVITQLNPYSSEFEASINWDDPVFEKIDPAAPIKKYPTIRPEYGGDVTSGESSVFYRQKLKDASYGMCYRFMDNAGLLRIAPTLKETGIFELMGRSCPRPEDHQELTGIYAWGKLVDYLRMVFLHPRVNAPFEMPPKGSLFSENNGRHGQCIRRLINVFKSPDEESVCLTYVVYYKKTSISVGVANLSHIWIGVSDVYVRSLEGAVWGVSSKGKNVNAGSSPYGNLSYVGGGLPKLAGLLELASFGINIDTYLLQVETKRGKIDIPIKEDSLLELSRNGIEALGRTDNWCVGGNVASYSFFPHMHHEAARWLKFGILYDVRGNTLTRINVPRLERIQGFTQLREVLLALANKKVLPDTVPMPTDFSASLLEHRDAYLEPFLASEWLQEKLERGSAKPISEGLKKLKGDRQTLSYKEVIKYLAEPEFRHHLKV